MREGDTGDAAAEGEGVAHNASAVVVQLAEKPVGQAEQFEQADAPRVLLYAPEGHVVHALAPAVSVLYLPAPQDVQDSEVVAPARLL